MSTIRRQSLPGRLCLLVTLVLASVCAAQDGAKTYTYGIEISGELCGYAEVRVSEVREGGDAYTLLEQKTVVSASLLGLDVDQQIDITFHVDPVTGQYRYFSIDIQADTVQMQREIVVEGDTARCTSSMLAEPEEIAIPPGVILANTLYLDHARRDFVDLAMERQSYRVFDAENVAQPVHEVVFTRVGTEVLETTAGTFEVIVIDTLNKMIGAKARLWLNVEDGMVIKVSQPNGTEVCLAEPSVKDRITRASVDDTILAQAPTDITDVHAIAYMKVKASMEPVGAWLDHAALNVRGQRFEGTIEENRVEGIFEIEHARYDGSNAPPYPPDFGDDPALAGFLEAGGFIESDDPVLIAKAREIAEGSRDSWEAARKLSQWVADNIGYEIPGGVFARKVYDLRVGECGGHSVLLAAFCRAVGIPARGVWGCMYTPMGGGSFGQHAWTEIYMGEAGWIPVDSTAHEIGFVDSGHIRLGVFGTPKDGGTSRIALGAKAMEVLDYRMQADATGPAEASAAGKYVAYVGHYDRPGGEGEPLEVLVRSGRLAIDVPGSVTLPFHDPDGHGTWTCALSNLLYCRFHRDESGRVASLELHEIVRMRRRSDPEAIADEVPDDLRRYLGGYFLAQLNAEYGIIWDPEREQLGLRGPDGSVRHLQDSGEQAWTIEEGRKAITFLTDEHDRVISMSVDVGTTFTRRSEPAT